MRDHGTVLDAVGRAKHTLTGARGPGSAMVTVHGECPIAGCSTINVVEVHAGTDSITCAGCGQTFEV